MLSRNCARRPGVQIVGDIVNSSSQSRTATSSLSVRGERFCSARETASYFGGSSRPVSRSSRSASFIVRRITSDRPRVAISTACVTSSGLASASSVTTWAPIEVPTRRHGPSSRCSMSAAVSATRSSIVKSVSSPEVPRLSNVITR